MQIATVADLTSYGHDTHFHFGIRKAPYTANFSLAGALPQQTCTDPGKNFAYPAMPEYFVDPNNTNNVLFQ